MRRVRLLEAQEQAKAILGPVTLDQLTSMARDRDARQRLLALAIMRCKIEKGASPNDYLSLARELVGDPDNSCRWQALIVVGEALETSPVEVWEVIREHGSSADPDMRMGVAKVLLEHLLEEHFEDYFPKVRDEALQGSAHFADTLRSCWFDDNEGPRYRRVQKLLRNAARGRPKQE